MNVFLSWSGPQAHDLAVHVKNFLEQVLQACKVFCSSENIDKGELWFNKIHRELSEASAGLLIVTPANHSAPWLLFESGALLGKFGDQTSVCPILFGMSPASITQPLSSFNLTVFSEDDMLKLVKTLNARLTDETRRSDSQLSESFAAFWTGLESNVQAVLSATPDRTPTRKADREIIEEILENTRALIRSTRGQVPIEGLNPFLEEAKKSMLARVIEGARHQSIANEAARWLEAERLDPRPGDP